MSEGLPESLNFGNKEMVLVKAGPFNRGVKATISERKRGMDARGQVDWCGTEKLLGSLRCLTLRLLVGKLLMQ